MPRNTRKQSPIQHRNLRPAFGKTVSVQFLLEGEDGLIRDLASRENRSVANTVRVLALAEARRRSAQGERAGAAA